MVMIRDEETERNEDCVEQEEGGAFYGWQKVQVLKEENAFLTREHVINLLTALGIICAEFPSL